MSATSREPGEQRGRGERDGTGGEHGGESTRGGPERAAGGVRGRRRAADARRDPERTRQALLDAALAEFAEKGRAGARVSEIAARAGVNKQLISYHFDGKDGLYQALADRWLEREREFADPDIPLGELAARYARETVEQRELTRLFVRECIEDAPEPDWGQDPDAEPEELADLRRRQRAGEIAEQLDPAFVLLALQGAAAASVVFPADVRRWTGLEPDSPEFAERYAEQLRRLAELLAGR
ncbi:TetR/AcrR family transcriptional regulator [Conexibacter arvalis]|uniref:AcrR family transcriptional regulator n=1 Tax=Conexibacter arvalis TaxID=912552 RepID=A0A840IJF6_9ACTN|nr:TetR/AcrR family transcriptional regulator [Conexibacter arvalis]MBB4664154.1 AcrR family transcriptional regulator [Conexibacter arvalis]